MNDPNSFWQDKRCLVTGGAGFMGSHLCDFLHQSGARMFVVDKEACHPGTLFSNLNSGRDITGIQADLSEPTSVNIVRDIEPEYIFHLAALPYAPYTTAHPREAYAANVVSTVNMLEGA